MGATVKLRDVVEAMEIPREWEAFLDPETGEIVTISDDDRFLLDDEEESLDELPEWQRDTITAIRRVLDFPFEER